MVVTCLACLADLVEGWWPLNSGKRRRNVRSHTANLFFFTDDIVDQQVSSPLTSLSGSLVIRISP